MMGKSTIKIDGGEVDLLFAAEADEISALKDEIKQARRSIRFMTFVFSLEPLAEAMLLQAVNEGVTIEGVFEARNSTASDPAIRPTITDITGLRARSSSRPSSVANRVSPTAAPARNTTASP